MNFRDRVRHFRDLGRQPNSNIGLRVNPRKPMMHAEDINYLVDAVMSALGQSSTGSIGSMMTPAGVAFRSGPQGGGKAETAYFAVLRDWGTGQEHFINISRIAPNASDPWDGGYEVDLELPSEPVACFPGLLSENYKMFITRTTDFSGDAILKPTPILLIMFIDGVWTALQTFKFMLPLRERNPQYRLSDCYQPVEDV